MFLQGRFVKEKQHRRAPLITKLERCIRISLESAQCIGSHRYQHGFGLNYCAEARMRWEPILATGFLLCPEHG